MTRFILLIVCVMLIGCGYDRFGEYNIPEHELQKPTVTIRELTNLYSDKAVTVNQEYVIQGYVSTSDRENNFFRSFIIQDHSGAVEIMAGLYNLHNIYPLGQHVTVRVYGLTLAAYNSVVQLGATKINGGANDVDYIGYRSEVDRCVIRNSERHAVTPTVLRMDQLDEQYCGMLVRVENVAYHEDPPPIWGATNPVTGEPTTAYRKFIDASENAVYVSCSGYADFAGEQIPSGLVSLTGILQYGKAGTYKNVFIIKIRDLDDVNSL